MLIVFVLDTSASMNQRCNNGLTFLDCAKSAIEHFHKVRLRDASIRTDKYLLVTCARGGSNAIQVMDKFPFSKFLQVLKGIQAQDLTSIDSSFQQVFGFLHLQRLMLDIDKFGQGRNPCAIDPTTIVLLTDGTEVTSKSGIVSNFSISSAQAPIGAELYTHPFRWDQRIFTFLLRIPAFTMLPLEKDESIQCGIMDNTISNLCESTGGKCYIVTNWKALLQNIEATALSLVTTVIVSFQQASLPGSTFVSQGPVCFRQKMMFIRNGQMQGFWPIPESFFPDTKYSELPPREVHPLICYKPIDTDPFIPANFIYDKYEIENIPLMGVPNKSSKCVCWQAFIHNSKGSHNGLGDPFGFLRFNRSGSLTLFVLPYNYPVLWQLLKQVVKVPGSTIAKTPYSQQWRLEMEQYFAGIPPYYGPALRAALKKWGIHAQIIPDTMDSGWLTFTGNHHKKIKAQAKFVYDHIMSQIMSDDQDHAKIQMHDRTMSIIDQTSSPSQNISNAVRSNSSHVFQSTKGASIFKNPFDVQKDQLIRQIIGLPIRIAVSIQKSHFSDVNKIETPFSSLIAKMAAKEAAEERHSIPVEKMGDFSDALLKQQTPRNPYIEERERNKLQKTMFGNPFRLEKNEGAEEIWQEGIDGPPARAQKKKRRIEQLEASSMAILSGGIIGGTIYSEIGPRSNMHKDTQSASLTSVTSVTDIGNRGILDSCDVAGNNTLVLKETEQESLTFKYQEEKSHNGSISNVQSGEINVAELRKPQDVAEFLLSIIRILRHTRTGATQKLFEMLSVPFFPVQKCSFVKELIQQAYAYNKLAVAEELSKYYSEICDAVPGAGEG